MNQLYDRLRLQAQLRQIIDNYGQDQAIKIIEQALKRELNRTQQAIED